MTTLPDNEQRASRFPLGAAVELEQLSRDPNPVLAALRESEPVSWVPALNMYLVTRYDDVSAVLKDDIHYIVGTEASLPYDTFGEHMMTVDGAAHERYKAPHRPFFLPPSIRNSLEERIASHAHSLIDDFADKREVELRANFSARLPVLTMLSLFGLKLEDESRLRQWYDTFEAALSNFTRDEAIRAAGNRSADEFHSLVQTYLDAINEGGGDPSGSLLAALKAAPAEQRLSDEEIRRNALIIFFGGISTVDALILNTLYSLATNESLQRVREDRSLLSKAITETIRWLGPVQSATRHVAVDTELHGVRLRIGDTVNCMLSAANRDPSKFENPDAFDLDRANAVQHVGFAVGPHHCLGSHLARAEARIAINTLLDRLPALTLDMDRLEGPHGYEFRQPVSAVATF
ncbi:MAG: cytochrome P450 [Woeseiaceae bacterium]|nr:cytochrome P450 [Woeseiaceae bacterium]